MNNVSSWRPRALWRGAVNALHCGVTLCRCPLTRCNSPTIESREITAKQL
jgi:hypothetical protein